MGATWTALHVPKPPNLAWRQEGAACREKCWDALTAATLAASLLESTPNDVGRARLLATSAKELGAWLLAMQVTSLGLRTDDHN